MYLSEDSDGVTNPRGDGRATDYLTTGSAGGSVSSLWLHERTLPGPTLDSFARVPTREIAVVLAHNVDTSRFNTYIVLGQL
jgi:hypothetical protein